LSTIPELDLVLREALARRSGADLYCEACEASAISNQTVEAVTAVVARMADRSDLGLLVVEGFGEAIVADAAPNHLVTR
jgi:hypothetical protein